MHQVGHSDLRLPRIGFFAAKDIPPRTELTFDYGHTTGGKSRQCHCGAANCRGWLQ